MGDLITFYIIFYVGMAFYQVFAATIRLFLVHRQNSQYALGLRYYLLSVIAYFLILRVLAEFSINESFMQFYLFIFPWVLSIRYFVFILQQGRKTRNIAEYDKLSKEGLLPRFEKELLELEILEY